MEYERAGDRRGERRLNADTFAGIDHDVELERNDIQRLERCAQLALFSAGKYESERAVQQLGATDVELVRW